ncbi:MAG: hypothetical protein GEU80_15785 [Dehalococcoidia bacterium]|nr:hypothetical protein [Dehalococcoidia bacterium]
MLPEFRRVTLEQFIEQSSQRRAPFANFAPDTNHYVSIYEFLLPLTREKELRAALDDLFYEDTLSQRLQEIGLDRLTQVVPRMGDEADDEYETRVVVRVADLFGGYSIGHVNGRFRIGNLQTRAEAIQTHDAGRPYLVDETTAAVKFIVPLATQPSPAGLALDEVALQEAGEVRDLFQELFVKAVIRAVGGEEEVWFLEDSPLGRKLHRFRRQRQVP